jgi:putative ABC transport system permease protein
MAAKESNGFSFFGFLWGNLQQRPMRSALSILGIALQVFLVLFIVGLTSGIVADFARRVEGIGADVMVQPPGAPIFFALGSAVLPRDEAARLEALEEVARAAPVLVLLDTRGIDTIYGIEYESFNALGNGFVFLEGRPPAGPRELLVDDLRAAARGMKLGDTVELLGHEFTVSGIVAHGRGARFFIPLEAAQEISGAEDRVSLFYVRSSGDTISALEAIEAALPGHKIRSVAEFMTLMTSENLPELKPFVRSMVGLGVLISFLVVLLTMYTMVLERTREIGILKALGASKLDIGRLLIAESLLMAVFGILAGVVLAFGARALLGQTTPTLLILIDPAWVLRAIALALAGAAAGALYPAYRAAGFDPVDALAYE